MKTVKVPGKKIARGLRWIQRTGRATLESAMGEGRTGTFSGTTENEIAAALEWLEELHGAASDVRAEGTKRG